uniref:GCS light chain n=1 Tax=Romanomermis culicivorax TaxID=13658 RepID=A0A915J6V6_ROMCU
MESNQQQNKPNPDLLNFLRNSDVFRVHTGNVNTWSDLKLRTFENMSEEMAECLRLQLSDWNPLQDELSTGGSVDFRLCTNKRCDAPDIKAYERENLKITVKVFLSDPPEAQDVKKCVQAFIKECSANFVDQIIVALAPLDPAKCIQPTLSAQMLKIWPDLEPLVVEDHLCAALGTSDLDVDDLERVYEGAKRVKPLVNHYNIAACCAVPPELKEYAKR